MSDQFPPVDRKSERRKPHILPVEDGPYEPWLPSGTSEQVRQWRKELDAAIVELSVLAGWPDRLMEQVLFLVERQPTSTLLPDLHSFRDEIRALKAEEAEFIARLTERDE
jgi:hypothetical protein